LAKSFGMEEDCSAETSWGTEPDLRLGLQEIEWVILGIIAADKLVDRGFL
jgi:hypothetical protein